MSEIKRFNHGVCEYPGGIFSEMNQEADGDYVLHSDHQAEVARLHADLEGYMMGAVAEAHEVGARGEEIKRLRAEVEAYRKDAERYRWLRDLPPDHPSEEIGNMPGDMWDEQIDAAMGASA